MNVSTLSATNSYRACRVFFSHNGADSLVLILNSLTLRTTTTKKADKHTAPELFRIVLAFFHVSWALRRARATARRLRGAMAARGETAAHGATAAHGKAQQHWQCVAICGHLRHAPCAAVEKRTRRGGMARHLGVRATARRRHAGCEVRSPQSRLLLGRELPAESQRPQRRRGFSLEPRAQEQWVKRLGIGPDMIILIGAAAPTGNMQKLCSNSTRTLYAPTRDLAVIEKWRKSLVAQVRRDLRNSVISRSAKPGAKTEKSRSKTNNAKSALRWHAFQLQHESRQAAKEKSSQQRLPFSLSIVYIRRENGKVLDGGVSRSAICLARTTF